MFRILQKIVEKAQTFKQTVNTTLDEMIQDVYIAVDAAQNAMNEWSDDILYKVDRHIKTCKDVMEAITNFTAIVPDTHQQHEHQPSKHWPNVHTHKDAPKFHPIPHTEHVNTLPSQHHAAKHDTNTELAH
jgi:hypothetical protein